MTCESDNSGWFDWAPAVYGTKGDSGNFLKNIAIQEAFHNLVDHCLSDVQAMTDDNEHDLGQIYSNYWNDTASPMISSYINDRQGHGDCQSSASWDGDYTQTLSSCTKDAMSETATEHYYQS